MGGRSDDKRAKEPRPEANLELPSFSLRRKKKPAEPSDLPSEPPVVPAERRVVPAESPVVPAESSSPAEAPPRRAAPPPPPARKIPAPPASTHHAPPPPAPPRRQPPAPPAPVVAAEQPTTVVPVADLPPSKPPKAPKEPKATKAPKPPKPPKAPKPAKTPKPPRAAKEPKPPKPKRQPKPPRERAAAPPPWLPGYVSAIVTGALCGALTVLLAWATGEGCAAIRGVGTCGGYGVFALVAILGIDVVVATSLLRLARVVDPATTAMLGVGLVAVLAMVFFLGDTQSFAMVYVIPTLMAATFAFAWWITKVIAQRVED